MTTQTGLKHGPPPNYVVVEIFRLFNFIKKGRKKPIYLPFLTVTIEQSHLLPLAEILSRLGFSPVKTDQDGVYSWYFSPLRPEKSPSFHVDLRKNRWFDFGEGTGGDALDLIIKLQGLDRSAGLAFLEEMFGGQNVAPKLAVATPKLPTRTTTNPLELVEIKPLTSIALFQYLTERGIQKSTAQAYLKEAIFTNNGRRYFALAFANRARGWEIRNPYFKGSLLEKDFSVIESRSGLDQVSVFEGFMDFLSCLEYNKTDCLSTDVIVLNSLAFQKKAVDFIKKKEYSAVFLYLDNDRAGEESTYFFSENLPKALVVPVVGMYEAEKDFNAFWVKKRFGQL